MITNKELGEVLEKVITAGIANAKIYDGLIDKLLFAESTVESITLNGNFIVDILKRSDMEILIDIFESVSELKMSIQQGKG